MALKRAARPLADKLGFSEEMDLIELVEKLTPAVFMEKKGSDKPMCANVDMYSGFVYKMLGLPKSLYTPLFATARIVGWMAHRLEEVTSGGKIIRPAYKPMRGRSPMSIWPSGEAFQQALSAVLRRKAVIKSMQYSAACAPQARDAVSRSKPWFRSSESPPPCGGLSLAYFPGMGYHNREEKAYPKGRIPVQTNQIPARADVPAQDKWAIHDLFATDDDWRAALAAAKEYVPRIAAYAAVWARAVRPCWRSSGWTTRSVWPSTRWCSYAQRKSDEDTRVAAYQEMVSQVTRLAVELQSAAAFETPELLAIGEQTLDRFYAEQPGLETTGWCSTGCAAAASMCSRTRRRRCSLRRAKWPPARTTSTPC